MSKSPNIFIPALGGTALVLGLAYGLWSRDYGARQIASLESRFEAVSDRASIAAEQVQAEAARAAELEQKIASIQAEAAERVSSDAGLSAPAPPTPGGVDPVLFFTSSRALKNITGMFFVLASLFS
jgi:cytochrome c